MAMGLTQPLAEIITRVYIVGDKGGRCVRPTTLPPSCGNCLEILEAPTSWIPNGLSMSVIGYIYLLSRQGLLPPQTRPHRSQNTTTQHTVVASYVLMFHSIRWVQNFYKNRQAENKTIGKQLLLSRSNIYIYIYIYIYMYKERESESVLKPYLH